MSKTKTILLIILIVFIVLVVCLWIYYQPKFEILDLRGLDLPYWAGHQISFKLKNNGPAAATGIHGTIQFGKAYSEKEWFLIPEDYVLKLGEISPYINVGLGSKPNELSVTITVECNEGVTQQFAEYLPP